MAKLRGCSILVRIFLIASILHHHASDVMDVIIIEQLTNFVNKYILFTQGLIDLNADLR